MVDMQSIIDQYTEIIEDERRQRAETLLADRGFLTLAGLFWLDEGDNTFGSGADNDIVLPLGSAPGRTGVFRFERGVTTVSTAPGVSIATEDGAAVTSLVMQPDMSGDPTYIHLGRLAMLVLQRGERRAVRLYDAEHPARKAFTGLRWYPIDPAYRIVGQFVAYDPPKTLPIVDVTGHAFEVESPGYVVFTWQGKAYRLDAQPRGARLFFNFADATNGDTTFAAGRFLYSGLPQTGQVELDFNRATNPYCAYTPYATCSLPPRDNHLDFRVEAGEMAYES
jgi:uncharacterized protein